jgi:hypothetical protein
MADTAFPIEALDFHVATAQGLRDLAVLLTKLLKDELTLESVVIFSTASIFTTLSWLQQRGSLEKKERKEHRVPLLFIGKFNPPC